MTDLEIVPYWEGTERRIRGVGIGVIRDGRHFFVLAKNRRALRSVFRKHLPDVPYAPEHARTFVLADTRTGGRRRKEFTR